MTVDKKLEAVADKFSRGMISISEAQTLMENYILEELGEGPRLASQNLDWYSKYIKLKRKSWRLLLKVTK